MAALSGNFLADFKSFDDACKKAVISLTDIQAGGGKVEKSLNRMADSFAGTKIIAEAKLMARVFDDAGGAASFTTAELARMGSVGAEAMEKLRKNGQPIPEQLMTMGRATRQLGDAAGGGGGASEKTDKFGRSLKEVDRILGHFGASLPPQVSGLADLATHGVTAAGGLSMVGVAALAAGVGFASWKVGEKIGEVTGLTQAIADGTAALWGWGDAIGQNAAYKADVLGKASKTAGRGITDMTEAMAINAAEAQRLIDGNVKAGAAALQLAGDEAKGVAITAANRQKLLTIEHDFAVKRAADDEALKKKLADAGKGIADDAAHADVIANGTASDIIRQQNHDVYLAKLADLVANGTDNAANRAGLLAGEAQMNRIMLANQETLHTGRIKDAVDLAATERNTYNVMVASGEYYREELDKELEKVRALEFAATRSGHNIAAAEDEQTAAAKRHNDALEEQKKKIQDVIDANELLIRTRTTTTEVTASNLAETISGTRFGASGGNPGQGGGAYVGSATALAGEGYSFNEILGILRGGIKGKPIGPRIPGFMSGIENFSGGAAIVGERGPELLNLPGGSSVRPLGGGAVIHNYTYISGVFDPASGSAITRVTSEGLTRALHATRLLG